MGISKEKLTSCFYFRRNNKIIHLPIDDSKFNYDYFDKEIYPDIKGTKVKLSLTLFENAEVILVNKIEKI